MTGPDYAARAAAGAAFLDGELPGWGAAQVSLDHLNLSDADDCVLGRLSRAGLLQLGRGGYHGMRDALGLSPRTAVTLGFSLGADSAAWEDWALLGAAWADEITRRREPAQVTPAAGLTEWHVEGVIRRPDDCGLYFDFDGTPQDLLKFISEHDCAKARDKGQQQ